MSIAALNWAWGQQAPTSTAKLVLVALADHANGEGECWPSMGAVAKLAQCSPRQVARCIDALEEAGLLTRKRRRLAAGKLGSYVYRLPIDQQTPTSTGHPRPLDTDDHKTLTSGGSDLHKRNHQTPMTSGHPRRQPPDTHVRSEPSKSNPKETLGAEKLRRRDPIFDALVAACGLDPAELTRSARGAVNNAVKQLREIGASPEGIHARARLHREQWPNVTCTPSSLAKNYALLGARPTATVGLGGGVPQ